MSKDSRYPERFPFTPKDRKPRILRDSWFVYDKPFCVYQIDFKQLDQKDVLAEHIDKLEAKDDSIIIDLMAPPTALRGLPHRGFFEKMKSRSLAVSLTEPRAPHFRFVDKLMGIDHISGDLNTSNTWDRVEEWLKGKKADLIMQRGYGALAYIPHRLTYYRPVFARSWEMLNSEGILIFQTPPFPLLEARGVPISKWLELLEKRGIDAQSLPSYSYLPHLPDADFGFLMLKKGDKNAKLLDILDVKS